MGLQQKWEGKWKLYTEKLKTLGLCRLTGGDRITWKGKKNNDILTVKEIYLDLIKNKVASESDGWFKVFWKTKWHRNQMAGSKCSGNLKLRSK